MVPSRSSIRPRPRASRGRPEWTRPGRVSDRSPGRPFPKEGGGSRFQEAATPHQAPCRRGRRSHCRGPYRRGDRLAGVKAVPALGWSWGRDGARCTAHSVAGEETRPGWGTTATAAAAKSGVCGVQGRLTRRPAEGVTGPRGGAPLRPSRPSPEDAADQQGPRDSGGLTALGARGCAQWPRVGGPVSTAATAGPPRAGLGPLRSAPPPRGTARCGAPGPAGRASGGRARELSPHGRRELHCLFN